MGFAARTINKLASFAFCISLFAFAATAQSTDQNFPTPLTTNEIEGQIKARDMGDPRATTYFYAFEGGQGDIFINVVAKNFSGDIDVFTVEGMTPLTKVVLYAEADRSETGRLIYLRKPEQLLLRIQGRTPNDDPATFRIKFGGSFIALAPQKIQEAPTVVRAPTDEPGIKVNSAGRIVAVVPKPKPTPKPEEPKPEPPVVAKAEPAPDKSVNKSVVHAPTVPTIGNLKRSASKRPSAAPKKTTEESERTAPAKKSAPPASVGGKAAKPKATPTSNPVAKPPESKPADALASIRLVIQMKDGTTFWFSMNEVVKFTVDKGVMTVIAKNGSITRYNILDVEKTTIQ